MAEPTAVPMAEPTVARTVAPIPDPALRSGPQVTNLRDTDTFFAESIDSLVDKLLAERSIPHERLEPGARPDWIRRVREVVLNHPKGQKRLI